MQNHTKHPPISLKQHAKKAQTSFLVQAIRKILSYSLRREYYRILIQYHSQHKIKAQQCDIISIALVTRFSSSYLTKTFFPS